MAELYASLCRWERNPDIIGLLGENLFMTLGPFTVEQPLGIWYGRSFDHNIDTEKLKQNRTSNHVILLLPFRFQEKDNYNFNTNSCSNGESCGYYTQVREKEESVSDPNESFTSTSSIVLNLIHCCSN